jgi:hypothetical protein
VGFTCCFKSKHVDVGGSFIVSDGARAGQPFKRLRMPDFVQNTEAQIRGFRWTWNCATLKEEKLSMLPNFLIPETVVREASMGPELSLSSMAGGLLLLTLGITRIIEQQSLDISVWGSADNADWGAKPLLSFPQKFYCGTYQLLLDLSQHPEIKYLRAKWQVSRWGRGDPKPLFGIYLFAQDASKQVAIARSA